MPKRAEEKKAAASAAVVCAYIERSGSTADRPARVSGSRAIGDEDKTHRLRSRLEECQASGKRGKRSERTCKAKLKSAGLDAAHPGCRSTASGTRARPVSAGAGGAGLL